MSGRKGRAEQERRVKDKLYKKEDKETRVRRGM